MSEKPTLDDYTLAGAYMPRPEDERTPTMQAVDLWEIASALEAKLSKMEELRVEVENVIGMAHSFANFPSWLEQLEKALAGGEEA